MTYEYDCRWCGNHKSGTVPPIFARSDSFGSVYTLCSTTCREHLEAMERRYDVLAKSAKENDAKLTAESARCE